MSVAALRALRAGNANARPGSVWLRRVVTQGHDKFAERGPGVNRAMRLRQGWLPQALIGRRFTAAEHTVRHAGLDPASRVSPVLSQVSTGLGACLERDFSPCGAPYFSLLVQRKVSKRKHAPRYGPATRARGGAHVLGVVATRHPVVTATQPDIHVRLPHCARCAHRSVSKGARKAPAHPSKQPLLTLGPV